MATDPIGQVFRLLTTEGVWALDARGSEPLYAEIQDYERNKIAVASGADTPRVAYGPSCWGAIAVFVAGAVVPVWVGRRQSEEHSRRFGPIVGGLTAVLYVAVLVYSMLPPMIGRSVPLRLTDLATRWPRRAR